MEVASSKLCGICRTDVDGWGRYGRRRNERVGGGERFGRDVWRGVRDVDSRKRQRESRGNIDH